MSNNLLKAYKDGSGSSGTPLHSSQSCWMSRLTQAPVKQQGVLVAPHAQTFARKDGLDHKQKRLRTSLNISSDFTRSYGVLRNDTKSETVGLTMGSLTHTENTYIRTPMDPSSSFLAKSPSSPHEKADPNLQLLSKHKSYVPNHAVNPGKITVFNGHLSNNDFGRLDQGSGKREKYSAVVIHQRSSFSPLLSNNHFQDLQISGQAGAPSLRPIRNVETMRICTAVNSAGNSHRRPPLYSKTTTHHVMFTSQTTGVRNESTQHRGVKIQPLWSSTDSEKDNFNDAETPRGERSFDLSAETDTRDVVALSNKNDNSGILFRPIDKSNTTRDKTLLASGADPREDKVRGKLPVAETSHTNSLDGVEASTSRTQSLEAENLLSCAEQHSESKPFQHFDECALQEEPSHRWVKRLKLSSSEIEESSLHEKAHRIKESSIPPQNVGPMIDGVSSLRTKNPIFQSSWIQRWCQDRNPSKSVVVCEPNTSKLPLDELEKKQFPSIAAVALMGKSVDGNHACKFTKRGPLVIWNSDDY